MPTDFPSTRGLKARLVHVLRQLVVIEALCASFVTVPPSAHRPICVLTELFDAFRARTWPHLLFKGSTGLTVLFNGAKIIKMGSMTFDHMGQKFSFSGHLPFRTMELIVLRR
jgi:hypothetical protein